mmetsp:Transcript_32316/g.103051  ORF Transcript_32316/g.103051 Transcript_32316/m.103051 type:complete len:228 (+) Transcript_32316:110-793(+)
MQSAEAQSPFSWRPRDDLVGCLLVGRAELAAVLGVGEVRGWLWVGHLVAPPSRTPKRKVGPVVPPNHRDGQRRQPSHLLAGSAARQRAHHSRERRFGADGTHARACAASSGAVGPRDVHSPRAKVVGGHVRRHQRVSIREDMHVGITTMTRHAMSVRGEERSVSCWQVTREAPDRVDPDAGHDFGAGVERLRERKGSSGGDRDEHVDPRRRVRLLRVSRNKGLLCNK